MIDRLERRLPVGFSCCSSRSVPPSFLRKRIMGVRRFDRLNTSGDRYSRVFNIDVSVRRLLSSCQDVRPLGRTETSSTRISMTGSAGKAEERPRVSRLGTKCRLSAEKRAGRRATPAPARVNKADDEDDCDFESAISPSAPFLSSPCHPQLRFRTGIADCCGPSTRALSMIERGIAARYRSLLRTSRECFARLRKRTEIDRGKWATLLLSVA